MEGESDLITFGSVAADAVVADGDHRLWQSVDVGWSDGLLPVTADSSDIFRDEHGLGAWLQSPEYVRDIGRVGSIVTGP
jgi:hypothetical protein